MSSPWKAYLCGIGPAILIEASITTAAAYNGSATRSLLELVRNKISKQTNMRNSISAEERMTSSQDFTSHKQLFCRYISINSSHNTLFLGSIASS
jgi:hypothetical protein